MSYADDGDLIRRTMHSHGVERRVALHAVQRIAALDRPEEVVQVDKATTRLAAPAAS
jgi:hypothetical protein